MCDQLCFDYLSCYGHPHLATPHIDALADDGTRFTRAYVQSPVCGPSRMSAYTGRYPRSHGSTANAFPLRVGEMTLGDHLRPMGIDTVLVGKTHMRADIEGMERLGVSADTIIGARISECGFDTFERDDGLHYGATDPAYNQLSNHESKIICERLNTTPGIYLGCKTPAEAFRQKMLVVAA